MKVFVSWSGEAGHRLGYRLREWLPSIVPKAKVFLSSEIPGGTEWFKALSRELKGANFGIVCLTPEALSSSWLAFEAGALWSQTGGAKMIPLVAGMDAGKVRGPFAQLQVKQFERRAVRSICEQLAKATRLDIKRFQLNFETTWPSLERDVRNDFKRCGINLKKG